MIRAQSFLMILLMIPTLSFGGLGNARDVLGSHTDPSGSSGLFSGSMTPQVVRHIGTAPNREMITASLQLDRSNPIPIGNPERDYTSPLSVPPPNAVQAPAASMDFEGLHPIMDCSLPPDPDGTVGPTYYVAFVNTYSDCPSQTPSGNVGFFLKSNGTLASAFYYPDIFSGFTTPCSSTTAHSDPQVVYDSARDRYLFVDITVTAPYQLCIMATLSNNPSNPPYCVASYATQTPNLPDYDKAGVWQDGFYVSYNPSPSDSRTVVFNKEDLESCGTNIRLQDFDMGADTAGTDNQCGKPAPNHIFRPDPASYNINTGIPALGEPEFIVASFCLSSHVYIFTVHVDWNNTSNSVLTRGLVATRQESLAPSTVSSPANPVDTLRLHTMTPAPYFRNSNGTEYLWTTVTVAGSTTSLSAIAWYQLQVINNSPTGTSVANQNIWNPTSTSRLQAAAAFDRQGNVLMSYTQLSNNQNPATAYAGRLVTDPANTLGQTETILSRGSSMGSGACGRSNPCTRWGDYSMNSIDPNGCTYWFTDQFYSTTDVWQWSTRIGAVSYPTCVPLTYGRSFSTTSLSFSSSGTGMASTPQTLTISSTGTGPIVVQPANVTGPSASDFSIMSNNCSAASAGIKTSCTIQLTCTPSAPGVRTATLSVSTNIAAADKTPILLSCTNGTLAQTATLIGCIPSTVAIRQLSTCTVNVNDTSAGFAIPSGNVSFITTVATGIFNTTSCILRNGVPGFASCSVSYSQTATNTAPTITASYRGDATHNVSSTTTSLTVYLTGDINSDCKVDIIDLSMVGAAFGSTPGSASWNSLADLNHDGKIDITDIVIVSSNFGTHC